MRHPSVARCRVVGAGGVDGSEEPWAFVVRSDASVSASELNAFLREQLSDYKLPRKFVFVGQLPVGRTGKIQLDEARKLAEQ